MTDSSKVWYGKTFSDYEFFWQETQWTLKHEQNREDQWQNRKKALTRPGHCTSHLAMSNE